MNRFRSCLRRAAVGPFCALFIPLFVVWLVCSRFQHRPTVSPTAPVLPAARKAVPRPDAGSALRQVGRSRRDFPAGPCMILHYPEMPTRIDAFEQLRRDDFGEVVFRPDSVWYAGQDDGFCSSTFNCCTFAVCDHVGLTTADWIATDPTADGFPTPIAVIIDSYADPVCEYTIEAAIDLRAFATDRRLKDDDLVCFERTSAEPDPLRRRFTHVGRVQRHDGVNRLLSKFGQGPIARTNLRFPYRMYPGANVIRVYRFRTRRTKPEWRSPDHQSTSLSRTAGSVA